MTELAQTSPAAPGATTEARTIARLWLAGFERERPEPAYLVEAEPGEWREVSWAEAGRRVEELANGLLALGIRKGDAVSILAQTTLEWALFDFALGLAGAIPTGIYANSSARDVGYVLEHSESVAVLCEDAGQVAKVDEVRGELSKLEHVFTFADLETLEARGRAFAAESPGALAERVAEIREQDVFTYIYTSGTTGPPKGCMISHGNYFSMVEAFDATGELTMEGDVVLLYLPLAHNFGRLVHLGSPRGYTIAFLPNPLRVADALPHVRPTVLPSVPRVYEKVHTAIVAQFDQATGAKRRLIDWALRIGRERSRLRQAGRPIPRGLAAQLAIADRLVYSKVKAKLGGRLRLPGSGAAPLALEIAEFFDALGITIIEGYGLTENTTAISSNRMSDYRLGTVGKPLPGIEVKLAEDGELLARGPCVFQGYYKDEEATAATFTEDGWLKTGDVATIDEDGFITITDRKKDIIVTAGGKNVAPQNIENDLKSSKYVSQALVIGDRRPYCAALITLDAEEIGKWAAEQGLEGSVEELARHPRVRELIQGVVDEANADRSRFEQVKRFAVLPRDFTMADGEITPTMKLKRRVAQEHFQAEIDALYAD